MFWGTTAEAVLGLGGHRPFARCAGPARVPPGGVTWRGCTSWRRHSRPGTVRPFDAIVEGVALMQALVPTAALIQQAAPLTHVSRFGGKPRRHSMRLSLQQKALGRTGSSGSDQELHSRTRYSSISQMFPDLSVS